MNRTSWLMLLGFVNNWLAPRANPIGVDIGKKHLRMAQVNLEGAEHKLVAAAMVESGDDLTSSLREATKIGKFHGKHAIISLPAGAVHVHHLKLPKMDDAALKKALPWELKGKIPINTGSALIRHIVAGEIYNGSEPQMEVVCFAAARETVDQLIDSAARAKLDVIGMAVPQQAMVDCFGHVYRRQSDREATTCYVELGAESTRVVVAHHLDLMFARTIAIRPSPQPSPGVPGEGVDVAQLVEELDLCRRYHEANFAKFPIDRLIFVGGGATNREMCQEIARQMNLPAQLGDPMVRLNKTSDVPMESGIDRRQPQPGWCVALGLSMGSARVKEAV